jgi:hypothetical protein
MRWNRGKADGLRIRVPGAGCREQGTAVFAAHGSRLTAHGILRRDRRGLGGFFEEIPAFVVVVISVSMFLATAYTTYGRMNDDRELSGLQDDSRSLCLSFRGLEAVLERGPVSHEPRSGVFEAGKLDALNSSGLHSALNAPHPYNLTLRDLVSGQNWSFGGPVPAGAPMKASAASAVVVADGNGRHDPARLEVVMWP